MMVDRVAVVVPVYRRPTPSESLSLLLVSRILCGHSIFLLMPESLPWHAFHENVKVIRFPSACFASVKSYAQLMVSGDVYELFTPYEYILVFQLDCLVFRDELARFCDLGWDYVAPLILGRDDGHWPDQDVVGVGGLSLRKVASFLRILTLLERPEYRLEVKSLQERIERNGAEDMFWCLSAPLIDPGFSVAVPEVALAFGFEGDPDKSYRRAEGRQPFACHHWNRLPYFLWYIPWIPLSLVEKLILFPAVFNELLLKEVRHQSLRVHRFLRHHLLRGSLPE